MSTCTARKSQRPSTPESTGCLRLPLAPRLKGQSRGYFLYFCHKVDKSISKYLAHGYIVFRLLMKQNQMIFF